VKVLKNSNLIPKKSTSVNQVGAINKRNDKIQNA